MDPGDIMYDDGPEFCPWCGHGWPLHDDPYGCQIEGGDTVGYSRHGVAVATATGPCGCRATRADAEGAQ